MNGKTNSTKAGDTIVNGVLLPLEPPASLTTLGENQSILIQWTDPADKYTNPGEELVVEWDHSTIVRKETGAPNTPDDGVLVATENTRDQYSQTAYRDEGLENGKAYYYSVFSHSTNGLYSLSQSEAIAAKQELHYLGAIGGISATTSNVFASTTGNYAVFVTGGTGEAYDSSLTKVNCDAEGYNIKGSGYLCNKYALFWYYSKTSYSETGGIESVNPSLTVNYSSANFPRFNRVHMTHGENYVYINDDPPNMYYAETHVLDSSLTIKNITPYTIQDILGNDSIYQFMGCHLDKAIMINWDSETRGYSTYTLDNSGTVVIIDSSGVFGTGMYNGPTVGHPSHYVALAYTTNQVDLYNEHFTHSTMTLPFAVDNNNGDTCFGSCCCVDDWAIFFGNSYTSSPSMNSSRVYVCNPQLTWEKRTETDDAIKEEHATFDSIFGSSASINGGYAISHASLTNTSTNMIAYQIR